MLNSIAVLGCAAKYFATRLPKFQSSCYTVSSGCLLTWRSSSRFLWNVYRLHGVTTQTTGTRMKTSNLQLNLRG